MLQHGTSSETLYQVKEADAKGYVVVILFILNIQKMQIYGDRKLVIFWA